MLFFHVINQGNNGVVDSHEFERNKWHSCFKKIKLI